MHSKHKIFPQGSSCGLNNKCLLKGLIEQINLEFISFLRTFWILLFFQFYEIVCFASLHDQGKANSAFFLTKRCETMFLFGIAYRSETRFLVFMPNFLRIRSIRFLTRVTDVFFVLHRSIYDEYIGLLRRIHR